MAQLHELKTARQLTHRAILRAQEVNNERDENNRLRDLTDAEATFLASVHLIGMRRVQTVGIAAREHGYLSEAHQCAEFLAARQERDELTLALEVFEASVEASDLVDEIELAEAAE